LLLFAFLSFNLARVETEISADFNAADNSEADELPAL
jgi:hypothetical protein